MTNQFVESLRRLFHNGNVSISKLQKLQDKKTINEDDYLYITEDQEKKVGD